MVKAYQPMLKELYDEILKLETEEECEAFFSDLCTMKELQSMGQRLLAAKMLLDGKTYNEVIEETDISSATLARVSKCVRYGDGGYANVIKKEK
jgi:TrpR-related protein YerC/YecD